MNNAYKKWGLSFLASLWRHVSACTTLWGWYEYKYQEFNWHDMCAAFVVGALVPTLKEFFSAGIPKDIYDGETVTKTEVTINETTTKTPNNPPTA